MRKQEGWRPALCEQLENRLHLSAAPTEAHVSFLPGRLSVAPGYVADHGATYGDRGGGLVYGWNVSNSGSMRYHRSRLAPDARYQTFALLPYRRRSPLAWEIAVPDGTYQVHLVAGDGSAGARVQIAAEGVSVLSGRTTRATRWIEATVAVAVSDGRLTITAGSQGRSTLDFVDIVPPASTGQPPQQPVAPAPLGTLAWHQVAPIPVGLTEAMGDVVGRKLYVFGGYTDTSYVPANTTFCYDPATNAWTRRANMPVGSTHTGTAADDRYVYLAGGDPWNTSHTAQVFGTRAVWRYDTITDAFSSLPPLPEARGRGALVLIGRELHYVSGCDAARIDRHEHWALDLDHPSGWVARAPIPIARNHPGSAVLDGKLYMIGGAVGEDAAESVLSSVEVYDPATDAWSEAPPLPTPRALVMSGVDVVAGRIVAAGGETAYNAPTDQVTAFDPATNRWTQLTPLPLRRTSGILRNLGGMLVFTTGHPGFNTTTWAGTFA